MEQREQAGVNLSVPETRQDWDEDMVCRAKESTEDLNQLMAAMMPTARRLADVYARPRVARGEKIQDVLLLIHQAVNVFQPGRAPFDHFVNFIAAKRLRATPRQGLPPDGEVVSLEALALDAGISDISCLPCMAYGVSLRLASAIG